MNRNNETLTGNVLFNRIHQLSDEADWSVDELRGALIEEGIDPDQLVDEVKSKIRELLDDSMKTSEHNARNESTTFDSLPLLPKLRQVTKLKAAVIAEKLGVSVIFLSDLSSHPGVAPQRARREFAKRAKSNLLGVNEDEVFGSFECSYQPVAAFRDQPFLEEEINYEKIVKRSDMSDEQKQYWLSLAEEEE